MLLRFVYLAFCATLRVLDRSRRGELDREAEFLILRHEVAVLRRTVKRPRLSPAERTLLAALARLLRPERRRGLVVTPTTLVRWPSTRLRRFRSRNSRDSLPVAIGPDTIPDIGELQPAMQTRLGDPEVLRDHAQRRQALPGHANHITTELQRERLRHNDSFQ